MFRFIVVKCKMWWVCLVHVIPAGFNTEFSVIKTNFEKVIHVVIKMSQKVLDLVVSRAEPCLQRCGFRKTFAPFCLNPNWDEIDKMKYSFRQFWRQIFPFLFLLVWSFPHKCGRRLWTTADGINACISSSSACLCGCRVNLTVRLFLTSNGFLWHLMDSSALTHLPVLIFQL